MRTPDRLPSWIPNPLARLLGRGPTITTRIGLVEQLMQAHNAAVAEQERHAESATGLRTRLQFLPSLLTEVRNATGTAAHLNHLASLAEQLPDGEMERALHQRILGAAQIAEQLGQDLAVATSSTMPRPRNQADIAANLFG